MSIGKYRPGVWSSYTVTPSYTGTREALAVAVIAKLSLDEDEQQKPVVVSREDAITTNSPLGSVAELLFGAGLSKFTVYSVTKEAEDADAYTAALEALSAAGDMDLVVLESASQNVLEAAKAFAEARSENQKELLVFAGCPDTANASATLAQAVNSPRVVLSYGTAFPAGKEEGSPFLGALSLCAAVAVLEDPSVSLTGWELPGIARVTGASYSQVETLLGAGVTPLAQTGEGAEAVRILTTCTTLDGSPSRAFTPINTILIIDTVMKALRRSLASFLRGAKNSAQTLSAVASQITVLLGDFLDRGVITGYGAPKVYCEADDPEVCIAEVSFTAAYLINQIHIQAQIQL